MSRRPPCVIKFGGTALATPRRVARAARAVRALHARGRDPVVVCSAAGHDTDRLLAWCRALGAGPLAANVGRRGRERDRALATGEDRSAALLALALELLGLSAKSLRGHEAGLRADGRFGAGDLQQVDDRPIRACLADGQIPVISGFHATRADGETVTLGRGASDLVAVAIAAALRPQAPRAAVDTGLACAARIVTDVDGVYEADPRRMPGARRYARLTHASLVRLAERGDQVVQAPAARLAAATGTPLVVSHFRRPLARGASTIVHGTGDQWAGSPDAPTPRPALAGGWG
jgi:aspartate kinase